MYTWVSSQSPLCCWFPPAAPMFGTMQETLKDWKILTENLTIHETFKNWKILTENLFFYLCWECGAHWVGQTLTLPILFTVHEELQNVPAVPWKEVIEESSSPGKFVIQEAISKMELEPQEEEIEEFAWDSIHEWGRTQAWYLQLTKYAKYQLLWWRMDLKYLTNFSTTSSIIIPLLSSYPVLLRSKIWEHGVKCWQ